MTWEIQKFKGSYSQLKLHHPETDLLKFWHFLPIIFNIFQVLPLSWIWKSENNKSHWLSSLVVQVGPSSSLILTQLFLRSAKVLCRNSVVSHSIPLFLSGQFPLLKMVLEGGVLLTDICCFAQGMSSGVKVAKSGATRVVLHFLQS